MNSCGVRGRRSPRAHGGWDTMAEPRCGVFQEVGSCYVFANGKTKAHKGEENLESVHICDKHNTAALNKSRKT